MEVTPNPKGGVTFLFQPTDLDRGYNFWVYICPLNIPFSGKEAVKRLRANVESGIVPWGFVKLDEQPALQTALAQIGELDDLPSSLDAMIQYISNINIAVELQWEAASKLRSEIVEQLKMGIEPSCLLGNPFK